MNIALGVGGGIAAYKAAELARALMTRGFTVNVIMTQAAEEFIRPLTFSALTGRKVITGLFTADTLSSAIEHIQVAQENDILVVAPATADLLAKFAHGLADDFLSTTYLAFTGRVVLAPAMNTNMWNHPATQANLRTLRERGHLIVDPDDGALACGMVGPGRLAEPDEIATAVAALTTSKHDLEGETVLITAGPTQEPLDAVRYLSNRSSGKMGYALAEEARSRGAKVILISGPVGLPDFPGAIHVQTAAQMFNAVMSHLEESTIIIKAAAVADYHRSDAPQYKVKKTAARMSIELDPTVDILAELGQKKGDRLLIGFAAETENLIGEARRKLESKNCDMVVANLVSQNGIGFDSDENEVVLVTRDADPIAVRRAPKRAIAARILDETMKLRLALHAK
ncbi:MAG TPA: bifunctional phosphopantothenoylcysteine decarboxylase/phosphopantothenate--cysteine ligase CoaBC [Bryobacteraceae bacterium]|nr:bifunctional phosphopantothenoylcysteine decarboxylase/phosphopantothenate--cysteine ligase CoaBC [Bryobacteraceae bacterium]